MTRRTFDPLLRDLAANSDGVELFSGWAPVEVQSTSPAVIEIEDRNHGRILIRSRLLVGADGRNSTVARLAGVPGRVRPHNRFFYFAYWRGIRPQTRAMRVWLQDPDGGAAQFPNEDDLTMMVASFHRRRGPEVRTDVKAAYLGRLSTLPDGPDLNAAERVSKVMGKLEVPNVIRLRSRPGLAFIGDANIAADPLFGVGIGFALQSGEWLADATAQSLLEKRDLEAGLRRYRRTIHLRHSHHHLLMASYASGRRFCAPERHLLRRAAADPVVRSAAAQILTRERGPLVLAHPRVLAHLLAPVRADGKEAPLRTLNPPPQRNANVKEAA